MNRQTKAPAKGKAMVQAAEDSTNLPTNPAVDAIVGWLVELFSKLIKLNFRQWSPYVLLTLGIIFWFNSLPHINLNKMDDLGLVSAMPPGIFVALGLITISFATVITAKNFQTPLVFAHMVLLVFMLYGITALVEEMPRFGPSWRHAGVIDYIMRNEAVNPRIDAYFNWPGLFIMGALITQIAGLDSAVPFLAWAPVFFQLIYMGPLWMIYSSLTESKRLVWLGIWIFYITNWVGQDYFSPQAMNYFYLLVTLAIFIRWFRQAPQSDHWYKKIKIIDKLPRVRRFFEMIFTGEVAPPNEVTPLQKAFFLLMVVMIYFVSITSHQLTQFAILISLVLLLIFQRITPKLMPVIMLILSAMWITYMASAFMAGRLAAMLAVFGRLDTALDANLVNRVAGSPGHIIVTQMRLWVTLGIWLAAFFGVIRRWINGSIEVSAALLVAAPFPLLAMQTYGGEMLMRIFLFSLPLAAYLGAALVFPLKNDSPSLRYTIAIGAISAVLIGVFWYTRYGNERMEYFTPAEVATVDYSIDNIEHGSLLATVTTNLPYKYRNYEAFKYVRLEDPLIYNDLVAVLNTLTNPRYKKTYFMLTRSQQAYVELFYGHGAVDWTNVEKVLLASPNARLVFENPDGRIIEFDNNKVIQ